MATDETVDEFKFFDSAPQHRVLRLPEGFDYKDMKVSKDEITFCCNSLQSEVQIKNWVKLFGDLSYVSWRVAVTYNHLRGVKCKYRIDYRCQHGRSSYKRKCLDRVSKVTRCPAKLVIKMICDQDTLCESTVVFVQYEHNHETGRTETSMRCQDVGPRTEHYLRDLYSRGHSPFSAHQMLLFHAFIKFGSDYHSMIRDRKYIPDLRYCYNLFYKYHKTAKGSLENPKRPILSLKKFDHDTVMARIAKWVDETDSCVGIESYDGNVIVTMLTPLMKRVHQRIKVSGQVICVDKINFERSGHCIYFLSTPSVIGDLPLCYIATCSSDLDLFKRALNQLHTLGAEVELFHKKGVSTGPAQILVNDELFSQWSNKLKEFWPTSQVIFSPVEALRAVWSWLIRHEVEECRELFLCFRRALLCKDEAVFSEFISRDIVKVRPQFSDFVVLHWQQTKKYWQQSRITNATHVLRAVKDIFMHHSKVFNLSQLIDLVMDKFDRYYSGRILDLIGPAKNLSKYLPECSVSFETISYSEKYDVYMIDEAGTDNYLVDVVLGFCTCSVGLTGVLCKHQCSVMLFSSENQLSEPCYTKKDYRDLFFVSTGKDPVYECSPEREDSSMEMESKRQNSTFVKIESNAPMEEHNYCREFSDLRHAFEEIISRVKNDPEMIGAVEKFCINYNSLSNDDMLWSAMGSFGKSRNIE